MALAGETANTLSIASVSPANAGNYTVVVTNLGGSTTSSVAVLSVPVVVATGPTNTAGCPGGSVMLCTVASGGGGPLSYQWCKGVTPITDATNSCLTLTNLSGADVGTYTVKVTGSCDSVTNSAVLSLNTPTTATGPGAVTNACPGTMVTLRVAASAERVLIEVQDECGGLPRGNVEDLFRPFAPSHPDRTGIALGLSFSRWAVEANHGSIYARDVSGVGCVFTLDLPRLPLSTLSIA